MVKKLYLKENLAGILVLFSNSGGLKRGPYAKKSPRTSGFCHSCKVFMQEIA